MRTAPITIALLLLGGICRAEDARPKLTKDSPVFQYDWTQRPGKTIVIRPKSITYLSYWGATVSGGAVVTIKGNCGMTLNGGVASWKISSDKAYDFHVNAFGFATEATITCGDSSIKGALNEDRSFAKELLHIPAGESTVTIRGDGRMHGIELVEKSMKEEIAARIKAAHSDTSWLGERTYGIMLQWGHWGLGEGNLEGWQDVYKNLNVERFANLMEEMGAGWVVWSITWCGQHLSAPIRAYENILAGYTMEYDFLGKLADELKKRDIKLIFYYHPGQTDRTWYAVYTGWKPDTDERVSVDRTRWARNFSLITQEIGARYGDRLHGWMIDGGRHYYPAPYETFATALKTGNKDRIVAFNPSSFQRVTDYQDFYFGERYKNVTDTKNGIIQSGRHKGLQAHGNWIVSGPHWGLRDPAQKPADPPEDGPRGWNTEKWLAYLAHIKPLKAGMSPCITMALDGKINKKAYDMFVESRRQFRGISDKQLIEVRKTRGVKNPTACTYIW